MSNLISDPATFCVLTLITTFIISNMFDLIRSDILSILILIIIGGSKILTTKELFFGLSSETAIALITSAIIFSALKRNNVHAWLATHVNHTNQSRQFLYLLFFMLPLTCILRGTNALILIMQTIIFMHYNKRQSFNMISSLILAVVPLSTLTLTSSIPLLLARDLLTHLHCSGLLIKNVIYSGICIGLVTIPIITNKVLNAFPLLLKLERFKFYNIIIDNEHPWHDKSIREIEHTFDDKTFIVGIITEDNTTQYFPRSNTMIQAGCTVICATISHEVDVTNSHSTNITNMTLLVPNHHKLIGYTYRDLNLSRKHKFLLYKLIRPYIYLTHHIKDQIIKAGDVLLGIGLANAKPASDLIITTTHDKPNKKKLLWIVLLVLVGFILLYGFHYSIALSLLAIATFVILCKALPQENTYQDIDWKTLFIIVSHLAMMKACLKLHLITKAANFYIEHIHLGYSSTIWLISTCTTLLTLLFNPIETVIYLVPIGVLIAPTVAGKPQNVALLIALASLNVFIKPKKLIGHMVYFYGNRTLKKSTAATIILTITYWLTLSLSAQLLWS